MSSGLVHGSPVRLARIAAVLNLLSGPLTGVSVSVLSKVLVRNDPSATAANLVRLESLVRTGMVSEMCALIVFVASLVLMFELFKPAGARGALLFLVFTVMGGTIQALDVFGDAAALLLLKGNVVALPAAQAQTIAFVFLRMHSFAYTIALLFMGVGYLCLGQVIRGATFIPRLIGICVIIEGLGYVVNSLATLQSPAMAAHIQPAVPYLTAMVGEAALMLWLLVKGVDAVRWEESRRQHEGRPAPAVPTQAV